MFMPFFFKHWLPMWLILLNFLTMSIICLWIGWPSYLYFYTLNGIIVIDVVTISLIIIKWLFERSIKHG